MSFSNFIGKVQSVFINVCSEIKETFSEENISSLFDFDNAEDYKTEDIENLNNDYLAYQSKVDNDKAQQEQYESLNAEQMKRFEDSFKADFELANFPSSIKGTMSDLYDELSNTTDINEAERIIAEIECTLASAEANGTYTEQVEGINKNLQISCLEMACLKQTDMLQSEAQKAQSIDEENAYFEQIEQTQFEFNAKTYTLKQEGMIENATSFTDEQKQELGALYNKLAKTTNEEARNSIQAEIDAYCLQENIQDISTIEYLNSNAELININNKSAILNEQKMACSNNEQKAQIDSVMREEQSAADVKMNEHKLYAIINDTTLPETAKNEISRIFSNYSDLYTDFDKDTVMAEINAVLAEHNFDTNSREYIEIEFLTSKTANDKELTKLFNMLSVAVDPAQKEEIQQEINSLMEDNNQLFEKRSQDIQNKI